jgi:hypothetical protein
MYILAIRTQDNGIEIEDFWEFDSLSKLKDEIARIGVEMMTSETHDGCDFDLDEHLSVYEIYKQVRIDENQMQKLQDRIFDNMPKQLKDLAKKISKRRLKAVV